MFMMSREELIARLIASTKTDYSSISSEASGKMNLLLYIPGGVISCTAADIPTLDELVSSIEQTRKLSTLEMALVAESPVAASKQEYEEMFLYCKDAKIVMFSGDQFPATELVVPLSSVLGFSLGSVKHSPD